MAHLSSSTKGPVATVLGIIGIGLYLVAGFFYLSSGLMVPGPWLIVLWAIWVAGIYVLVMVFRRARGWTPLVPIGAVLIWWAYVSLGGALLGWTP